MHVRPCLIAAAMLLMLAGCGEREATTDAAGNPASVQALSRAAKCWSRNSILPFRTARVSKTLIP